MATTMSEASKVDAQKQKLNPEARPFSVPLQSTQQQPPNFGYGYYYQPIHGWNVLLPNQHHQKRFNQKFNQNINKNNTNFQPFVVRPQFYYGPPNPGIVFNQGALRYNIVKQVEYYFSDLNLKDDFYLVSLMDEQGWVPLSTVCGFKRLKHMCEDIGFITDSLVRASSTLEVQGGMIRRRHDWSKWVQKT